MAYRLNITWRVTATSHDKEETVVESLADIGRAVAEGAPRIWDVAYVVIVETTVVPQPREASGAVLEPAA